MRLPNVNPAFLAFGYRFELMKREFEELDADIVCLQEATIDRCVAFIKFQLLSLRCLTASLSLFCRWDDLKAFMADLGYDCVVQLKPHEVKLAVFWRLSKLSLKWWEERSRAVLAELSLGTGAASSPLYIVNVHLEGNPYRGADRVSQLRHALQRLAHHIEASGRDPGTAHVALVGDFNSLDCDAPATFLRQGFLPAGYTDEYPSNGAAGPATDHDISHPFQLRDVYEAAQAVPPFTRKVHHRGGARLDFVWATPGLGVGGVLRPLPLEHRD
jgi:endonuclease/exonuclease/phosphatase family metal-dependent hydrolase